MGNTNAMKCVFYSYKGGSGRTTSLVNVAYQLRRLGKSVCIIDFDFDSPGVILFDYMKPRLIEILIDKDYITYFTNNKIHPNLRKKFDAKGWQLSDKILITESRDFKIDEKTKVWTIDDGINDWRFYAIKKEDTLTIDIDHKGILDFLSYCIDRDLELNKSDKTTLKELNIKDCIYEVKKESKFDGSLHIMGVSTLKELANLKAKIERQKSMILDNHYLNTLINHINIIFSPDYILIDSRPGREYILTLETMGIGLCEGDLFIICTNYNQKNVEVTLNVAKLIKDKFLKNINIPVALLQRPTELIRTDVHGPLIANIEKRVLSWELYGLPKSYDMSESEEKLITVGIAPDQLLDYIVVKEKHPNFTSYKRFAKRIVEFNDSDIINKIFYAKKGNINEIRTEFEYLKLDSNYRENYLLYLEFGKILCEYDELLESGSKELEIAYKLSENIEGENKGGHPDIALLLGKTYDKMYSEEKNKNNIQKAVDYIQKAVDFFEKAEKLKCGSEYELYLEWSKALFEYSKLLSAQDGIEKLETAEIIIEKAINSKDPKAGSFETMETKGEILIGRAALIKENIQKIEVLNKSNKALETSELRGGEFKTHYLLAKNLYNIALLITEVDKRIKNLKEADDHFEIASRYQKEDVDANYFWGLSLALLAKYNSGDKQRNLLIKASEKLSTAANIKKGNQKTNFYLGAVLFMLEKLVDESQRTLYFRDGFYNMEWTVSIHHKFLGFYFKAEDIQRIKNTYEFVRMLEKYYEYDPLFEEWVGELNTSKEYEDILKKAIQDHRDTINEGI